MFYNLVAIVATCLLGFAFYLKWSYNYWQRKKVDFLKPSFPFGNMENPFNRQYSMGQLMKKYYDEFKVRGSEHGGLFNFVTPVYLPIAPESVQNVMQNDFNHFVDRGFYLNEKHDPLSAHLFAIGGQKWRKLRTKLTSTFTSGKMKTMFDILLQCGAQMKEAVDKIDQPVDIKDVVARFTTDIIGSCAFGLECNSFKCPDAEFRKHGKKLFGPLSKLNAIKLIFWSAKPELANALGVTITQKDSSEFFFKVIRDTVKFREDNNFSRNDMLQLLIELMNNKEEYNRDGKSLKIEEVAAQALVFFLAGFETSSTTMTYCLFELAQNQTIQQKVRQDIQAVLKKNNGKLSYDTIKQMKYLQQVIEETMRKYPPLPFLNRRCVKDYKLPGSDAVIEKGTLVFLSILGLHHDEEFFPAPQRFDPERFSEENKPQIRPFTYLPFGEGPRVCIGIRFGIMQVKLGLITLLNNYNFTLSPKTTLPLNINRYTMILTNENSIWLNAEKY